MVIKKKMQYKIVQGNWNSFDAEVTRALDDGWWLHGAPFTVERYEKCFFQAMTKIDPYYVKPAPTKPPNRLIREGTLGECTVCGSTVEYSRSFLGFNWGKKLGCINPNCSNYYCREQRS